MNAKLITFLFSGILFSSFALAADAPFKNVDVAQFEKLRKNTNAVVLDVRTKKEFDAGHIPGATNIDVNAPDFEQKVSKLDKNKTYLVHCAAGKRSAKAAGRMAELKFRDLVNLEGGYTEWQKAGNQGKKE